MRGRNKFRLVRGGRRDWSKKQAYQPQPQARGWRRYSPLWLGAVLVGLVVGVGPSWIGSSKEPGSINPQGLPERAKGVRTRFSFCHTGGGYNCVVDGDTIYLKGVKIRIADIDTPETHDPRCAYEKSLGDRATQRLLKLVNSGEVRLAPIDRDEDSYGRKLRIVMVDGESVGDTLVREGLARWYEGGRRPWC